MSAILKSAFLKSAGPSQYRRSGDGRHKVIVARLKHQFMAAREAGAYIDSMVDLVAEAEERSRKPWYRNLPTE